MNKLFILLLLSLPLFAADHTSKEAEAVYGIMHLLSPTLIKDHRAPGSEDYHPFGTHWHAIYAPLGGPEPAAIEFYVQQSHDPRTPQWIYVGCNGLYDRIRRPYTPVTEQQAQDLHAMLSCYPDALKDTLKNMFISSLKEFPQSRFILVKNWYEKYHKEPLNLQEIKK